MTAPRIYVSPRCGGFNRPIAPSRLEGESGEGGGGRCTRALTPNPGPLPRVFRYAPHHAADDFLRLGWVPSDALAGTIHGEWSVLMFWLCACPAPMPLEARR